MSCESNHTATAVYCWDALNSLRTWAASIVWNFDSPAPLLPINAMAKPYPGRGDPLSAGRGCTRISPWLPAKAMGSLSFAASVSATTCARGDRRRRYERTGEPGAGGDPTGHGRGPRGGRVEGVR